MASLFKRPNDDIVWTPGCVSYIPEAARKSNIPEESLGEALEAAMREAMNDATFQKVKRCSYAPRSENLISQVLGKAISSRNSSGQEEGANVNDPAVMEQLVQALLGHSQNNTTTPHQAFSRLKPTSKSMVAPSYRGRENRRSSAFSQAISANLPTISERNSNASSKRTSSRPTSISGRAMNMPLVRNLMQTMNNAPQRLEEGTGRFGRRNSEATSLMSRQQP